MKKPIRLTLRNNAAVAMHGHPPGSEFLVRASGPKEPADIVYRKRLADGTFSIVQADAPAKKPAPAKETK